jgi:DNA-directed RNA polymerase III subunit RPC8
MFTVVRIKDAIPVPACELDKPRPLAVANQIELKYSNRVIADVGLCICLHEIVELKDGLIYVSDSSVHIRAEFTLVVIPPESSFFKRTSCAIFESLI